MRAVRLRFLLVAVAVLVPLALLVWRALASVETERARRHELVAERLFDEMERALTDVLTQAEARPVDGFLSAPPEVPWVVGWFDIAADGTVATSAGLATRPDLRAAIARGQKVARADDGQRPGSTLDLAGVVSETDAKRKGGPPAKKDADVSAFDAVRSLNKAVQQRVERQKTLADAYRGAEAERDDGATGAEGAALDGAPFAGRLLDPAHLVLSRTVVHPDGRGGRQGLVAELPALGTALRAQALDTSELRDVAQVAFGTSAAPPDVAAPPSHYRYRHRFAEPFDAVTAMLALAPLAGLGGVWVLALAGLLVVAVLLGLLALYRMVAVAVGFAERRSNFVAAVTHELKTPLTAIRMYAEMLRDGIVPSDAKRDEYHRHITAESERLSRLIDNVLEMSRLERQARPMTLVVGAIGPVLEEAATMLRPHVAQAGLALRVEVAPGLPAVRFERDALLQIVFNLVDNAVKYAAGGEIVLAASARDDGSVAVRVRDHGPGVPREHLARVFEPFHRGERELTRRTKGTGIGLALVKGLGEAMGGRVQGHNAPDGGFEVLVTLPAAS